MASYGVRLGRAFVIGSVLHFGVTVVGITVGYRINVTPNVPLGLYRLTPPRYPLSYGELVTLTLARPLRLHTLLGSFTKPVAGLPGDYVGIQAGQLQIDGMDYGPMLPEAPAQALTDGTCLRVKEGDVFTASAYPRSYDSGYFGAVALVDVQRAIPVFTWEATP